MASNSGDLQGVEYKLVVVEAQSMRVLTDANSRNSLHPSLPHAWVCSDARVAASLTRAIRRQYGIGTIQLAQFRESASAECCSVHEIIPGQQHSLKDLRFVSLNRATCGALTADEFLKVRRIVDGKAPEFGRFAQPGWFSTLLAKTAIQLGQILPPFVRQLNQGIDFCLLSLKDVDGRELWFKAVGEPNVREYAITLELARRFPSYLPHIVATVPEWNGWVMENVSGLPLNETDGSKPCEEALTALARIQQDSVRDLDVLLSVGSKDWSLSKMSSQMEPLFEDAGRAMEAQTSTRAIRLTNGDLHQLKGDIMAALHQYANAGLPDTLLHGDIGHGNIIATPKGPVFLDWAEASVGPPFVCAEHLVADMARSNHTFMGRQSSLRRHYALQWKTHLRPSELEMITALSPAIGAFAYCLFAWNASRSRPDPTKAWPILRSMLRRTRHELDRGLEVCAWL